MAVELVEGNPLPESLSFYFCQIGMTLLLSLQDYWVDKESDGVALCLL